MPFSHVIIPMPTCALIASRSQVICAGIESALGEGFTCHFRDSEQCVLEAIKSTHPDVTLIDISLSSGDGLTLLRRLSTMQPMPNVIVISRHVNPTYESRALASSARGYVHIDAPSDAIRDVAIKAARGELAWSHEDLKSLRGDVNTSYLPVDAQEALTQRELDVLRQLALGLTNSEIASTLGIAEKTVRGYTKSLYTKLGVENRTQAAVWAARQFIY